MFTTLVYLAAYTVADKDNNCAKWADLGECTNNPSFMQSNCAASCAAMQQANSPECLKLVRSGGCADPAVALERCRDACFNALRANLTEDQEGNCWYWGTDGECEANPEWMRKSCGRSCRKLNACGTRPDSPECAKPFECPLERDRKGEEAKCAERARRGECRSGSIWKTEQALLACPYSCAVIDPPSASHTATRPMMKRSVHIDAHVPRHTPSRCYTVGLRRSLMDATCPHPLDIRRSVPWRERWGDCPRSHGSGLLAPSGDDEADGPGAARARARAKKLDLFDGRAAGAWVRLADADDNTGMTPRVYAHELPKPSPIPPQARSNALGSDPPNVVVQTVHDSPRVRLLHNFVSPAEAEALIALAKPYYHRSSTARAGSDDKRTSHSATLPSSDNVVYAVRQRIAHFCGYPELNLEPLQAVRYYPGEFYKPHHDYYNSCETWQAGNRHFTFLIYLNHVEEGGETAFPRLNLTVTPRAYTALVFNNVLDNGEPDERTLHEGVAPTAGVKHAINGWMRSKNLQSSSHRNPFF